METKFEENKCTCFTCRIKNPIIQQAYIQGCLEYTKYIIKDLESNGIKPKPVEDGLGGCLSAYKWNLGEHIDFLQHLKEQSNVDLSDENTTTDFVVLTSKQYDSILSALAFYSDYRNFDGSKELKYKTNDCRPDEYVGIGTRASKLMKTLPPKY